MRGEDDDRWKTVALGEVAELVMGQAPPGSSVRDWNAATEDDGRPGLPFVQGNAEFGSRFPAPKKWCVEPGKIAEPGDYLISVRAPVGALNEVDQRLAIGRGLAAIRFHGLHPRFGWQALWEARSAFERVSQGSTFEAINSRDLATLVIPKPSSAEQVSIANMLDAIDEAIEKTESVIAATEDLRKALLQELFAESHGDVRPLAKVLAAVIDHRGQTATKQGGTWAEAGVPVISARSIQGGRIVIDDDTRFVSNGLFARWMRVPLQKGDVLVTSEAPLGSVARVPDDRPYCLGQRLFGLRAEPSVMQPAFLYYAFCSEPLQAELAQRSTGTTAKGIRQEELLKVQIPVPPLPLQHQWSSVLTKLDQRRQQEIAVRNQLARVKAVTADALLSGRVRVPESRGVR